MPVRRNLPVVLAEDNPDDLLLVQMVFRRMGISNLLITVADGAEALRTIHSMWDKQIALIILDIKMPFFSGLDVLERLPPRQLSIDPPVVMFTSSDDTGDVRSAYDLGANAYVCKPVEYEEYFDTLERLLRFWLSDNRTAEDPRDHSADVGS